MVVFDKVSQYTLYGTIGGITLLMIFLSLAKKFNGIKNKIITGTLLTFYINVLVLVIRGNVLIDKNCKISNNIKNSFTNITTGMYVTLSLYMLFLMIIIYNCWESDCDIYMSIVKYFKTFLFISAFNVIYFWVYTGYLINISKSCDNNSVKTLSNTFIIISSLQTVLFGIFFTLYMKNKITVDEEISSSSEGAMTRAEQRKEKEEVEGVDVKFDKNQLQKEKKKVEKMIVNFNKYAKKLHKKCEDGKQRQEKEAQKQEKEAQKRQTQKSESARTVITKDVIKEVEDYNKKIEKENTEKQSKLNNLLKRYKEDYDKNLQVDPVNAKRIYDLAVKQATKDYDNKKARLKTKFDIDLEINQRLAEWKATQKSNNQSPFFGKKEIPVLDFTDCEKYISVKEMNRLKLQKERIETILEGTGGDCSIIQDKNKLNECVGLKSQLDMQNIKHKFDNVVDIKYSSGKKAPSKKCKDNYLKSQIDDYNSVYDELKQYASKKNYKEDEDVILRLYSELKTKYDNLLEKSINNDCGNIKSLVEITKGNPELRKLVSTIKESSTAGRQGIPWQGFQRTT